MVPGAGLAVERALVVLEELAQDGLPGPTFGEHQLPERAAFGGGVAHAKCSYSRR
jgi:hypothetical protein